jgi:uncharacterized protein
VSGLKDVDNVTVVETESIKFHTPLVLLGFVGPGLAGGIAVSHIAEELQMRNIAHIRSRYLPPAVVFLNGLLRHPFRIYSDDHGKLCIIVCELPLRSDGLYSIASVLLDWIEAKDVRELVILDGIPTTTPPQIRETFFAAEPEKIQAFTQKGLRIVPAGVIQGLAGCILNECLTRKIDGAVFLTPATSLIPDPEAAATLIDTLNTVYNLKITTQDLRAEAENLKTQLKEIAQRQQRWKQLERQSGIPEALYS